MSLEQKPITTVKARIWAASYDPKRDAFRVALENGQIFLLPRPIPEDDRSEILEVFIEGDGEVFTVIQASGNEFSVPWDVIESLASGEAKRMNREVSKYIGERVKTLRKERGLTQEQLSRLSGIKRPNIARLEAGTHLPGLPLLERLASALHVNISYLVKS